MKTISRTKAFFSVATCCSWMLCSAVSAEYIPRVSGTYDMNTGGTVEIRQNNDEINGFYELPGQGTVRLHAEYCTWTVQDDNERLVERCGFVGPFIAILSDGTSHSGTVTIRSTGQHGNFEMLTTHTKNGQTFHSDPHPMTRLPDCNVASNAAPPEPVRSTPPQTAAAFETEVEDFLEGFGL
jgi:hypothetical protein